MFHHPRASRLICALIACSTQLFSSFASSPNVSFLCSSLIASHLHFLYLQTANFSSWMSYQSEIKYETLDDLNGKKVASIDLYESKLNGSGPNYKMIVELKTFTSSESIQTVVGQVADDEYAGLVYEAPMLDYAMDQWTDNSRCMYLLKDRKWSRDYAFVFAISVFSPPDVKMFSQKMVNILEKETVPREVDMWNLKTIDAALVQCGMRAPPSLTFSNVWILFAVFWSVGLVVTVYSIIFTCLCTWPKANAVDKGKRKRKFYSRRHGLRKHGSSASIARHHSEPKL